MNTQVNAPSRQAALWDGRFQAPASDAALALSGSLEIDLPLAEHDVAASQAHVAELERLGLIDPAEAARLDDALHDVAARLADGSFAWHVEHEDIHMNVEAAVIEAVGPELGGMLQAGRSRNEEIVTDERRWLRDATATLIEGLRALQAVVLTRAEREHFTRPIYPGAFVARVTK